MGGKARRRGAQGRRRPGGVGDGRIQGGVTTTHPLVSDFRVPIRTANKGRREPVARSATRPAAGEREEGGCKAALFFCAFDTTQVWCRRQAGGRPSPPARSGAGAVSEDANARASGAEWQAGGAAVRAQSASGSAGDGGQGPAGAAARAGVPYGKTALELRASATMGGADDFSQKSISGCIPFFEKRALVRSFIWPTALPTS